MSPQRLGGQGQSLVLKAPPTVVPVSSNDLINLLYPQAKRFWVVRQLEVAVDPWLVRNLGGQRGSDAS